MAWYGDLIKLVRDNPQADEDELKALWQQLCDAKQSASDRTKREEQVRITTYNMVRNFVSMTNGPAVEAMTEMIARLPDETARQRYYKAEAPVLEHIGPEAGATLDVYIAPATRRRMVDH